MKIPFCTLFASLVLAASGQEMRDVTTHEQMVERLRVQRNNDPMARLTMVEGDDPSKTNQPADILDTSEFISFSGLSTLVPNGAILHVPDYLRSRVGMAPGTRIVTWSQFLAENRSWIEVVNLGLAQVAGEDPIPADLVVRMDDSRRVMVAAVQGGPISVPTAKLEAARAAAEAAK